MYVSLDTLFGLTDEGKEEESLYSGELQRILQKKKNINYILTTVHKLFISITWFYESTANVHCLSINYFGSVH